MFESSSHWQVRGDWLYFIDFAEGRSAERWALKKVNLSGERIVDVAELPQPPSINGLSVAPDESWFLYTVDNSAEQDLMMIEGLE